jgi:hypothetical protein
LAPCWSTNERSIRSSISVQGPFTKEGLRTFCHLWRHWTSVLPSSFSAILFQDLPPYFVTASVRSLSSSSVQWPLIFPVLESAPDWDF